LGNPTPGVGTAEISERGCLLCFLRSSYIFERLSSEQR
jgi:hypothetical protein